MPVLEIEDLQQELKQKNALLNEKNSEVVKLRGSLKQLQIKDEKIASLREEVKYQKKQAAAAAQHLSASERKVASLEQLIGELQPDAEAFRVIKRAVSG